MSLKGVLKQLAAEKTKIEKEIEALCRRRDAIDLVFATLGAPAAKPAAKAKTKAKGRPPVAKKPGGAKGRMTVREGILATVREAGKPVAVADIIKGTVAKSGKAVASIRTQVNAMANAGYLVRMPHDGRGFLYTLGSEQPVKAKRGRKKKTVAEAGAPVITETPAAT
ncbi:MAG: hypothetical protein MUE73_11705 [Planctomycetes bacterium]|jgi:hypothetical protein|nr:hypothetical protein [Planctomycetota bacterium]